MPYCQPLCPAIWMLCAIKSMLTISFRLLVVANFEFVFLCPSSLELRGAPFSNGGTDNDLPLPIVQRMKKQCNPTKTKSFKERNPDLDLDEIQQNPNIPDDIKAVLKESVLTLDAEEEEPAIVGDENETVLQSPANFKTKKELLAYIDDGRLS